MSVVELTLFVYLVLNLKNVFVVLICSRFPDNVSIFELFLLYIQQPKSITRKLNSHKKCCYLVSYLYITQAVEVEVRSSIQNLQNVDENPELLEHRFSRITT